MSNRAQQPATPSSSATTARDNPLWLQFWRDQRDDFHQAAVNPLLRRFWNGQDLAEGSRVFVPLCGKSLDLIWLLEQGHEVIGIELSPVAVAAFFRENGLKPSRRKIGKFVAWRHDRLTILCGDYFSLTATDLGTVAAVYDRAALTALPEEVRKLYVAHLERILPDTDKIFLLTAEEAETTETVATHPEIAAEVRHLYAEHFDIELTHAETLTEAGEFVDYKLYRLNAHPH